MAYARPSIERRETIQGLMTFNRSGFDWKEWCEKNPQFCNHTN